ncbi:hypothetical protein [Holdemanella sp.]|uniref:hypothetical protein n=1 Tax=Holdemanella sp. TaxID=1971762 RepID=UPI00258FB3C0|nr:hypothetical protein [Holdemanella sp.]
MEKTKLLKLAGATAMVLTLLTGCGGKEVDLTKGVSLETEGYNGHGHVYVDSEGVQKRIAEDAKIDYNDNNQLAFIEGIRYEIQNKKDSYKNGDVVVIKATYDENAAEQAGIKVSNDTTKLKVKGLFKVFKKKSDYPEGYVDKFNKISDEKFNSTAQEKGIETSKWVGNYVVTMPSGETLLYSSYVYLLPSDGNRASFMIYELELDTNTTSGEIKLKDLDDEAIKEKGVWNTKPYVDDETEMKKLFLKQFKKEYTFYPAKELK